MSSTPYSNIAQRWIIVLMSFLGMFNIYAMRVCLPITITKMVKIKNKTEEIFDGTCPDYNIINDNQFTNKTIDSTERFEWSEYTQGIILSSFYWGYIITNIPGGLITQKFGGKHTLGFGILSTAILTSLVPFCLSYSDSTSLIVIRVLMGIFEGPTYSSVSALMAQWIPSHERSKAGALVFAGVPMGTIFGTMASGLILQYSRSGWPTVFYFFGVVGILQFLMNSAFNYNKPSNNPYISKAEVKYLKENLTDTHSTVPPPPWRYILLSKPVWALVIASIGNTWGFLTISNDMPKYLGDVLKFSIQKNGYLSSIPYFCMWLISLVGSFIADFMISSKRMSIAQVRKIGFTFASLGFAMFAIAASYAGCNGFLAVLMLTLAMACMGCTTFTLLVNQLDLGPNYASLLTGIISGLSTMSGIMSPYIVGLITPNQTITEWRIVFWIVFILNAISNVTFIVFGSGEVQKWNDPAFLDKQEKKTYESETTDIQLLPIRA